MFTSWRLLALAFMGLSCEGGDVDVVDAGAGVDAGSKCGSVFPWIPQTDGAALLATRVHVVCWVDTPDRILPDQSSGLGRVRLSGPIAASNVPEDFVPFGFGSGGSDVVRLKENAFSFGQPVVAYCAAGISNDGSYIDLDLAEIFSSSPENQVDFFVGLSGGGNSAISSETAMVSAGILDPRMTLSLGPVVYFESNDCGVTSLTEIILEGIAIAPSERRTVSPFGEVFLVTAKVFDATACSDNSDIVDILFSSRTACEDG